MIVAQYLIKSWWMVGQYQQRSILSTHTVDSIEKQKTKKLINQPNIEVYVKTSQYYQYTQLIVLTLFNPINNWSLGSIPSQ